MTIRIEIERLVLDGLGANARERAQIGAALERELARLVRDAPSAGALRLGGAISRAQAPAFAARREPAPRTGEKIARSVYATLGLGSRR